MSMENMFEVHTHVGRRGVVPRTSAEAVRNLQAWQVRTGGPNCLGKYFFVLFAGVTSRCFFFSNTIFLY